MKFLHFNFGNLCVFVFPPDQVFSFVCHFLWMLFVALPDRDGRKEIRKGKRGNLHLPMDIEGQVFFVDFAFLVTNSLEGRRTTGMDSRKYSFGISKKCFMTQLAF